MTLLSTLDAAPLPTITSAIFATAVAWFLLKWTTVTLTNQIKEGRKATNANTLATLELYRLFLIHDAQVRGVSNTGEDLEGAHKMAFDEYQKLNDSLAILREKVAKNDEVK